MSGRGRRAETGLREGGARRGGTESARVHGESPIRQIATLVGAAIVLVIAPGVSLLCETFAGTHGNLHRHLNLRTKFKPAGSPFK